MTTKRKSVSYIRREIAVRIDVTATADKSDLTKDELDHLMSWLSDKAMVILNDAPYVGAPLNKIKVR